MNKLTKNCVRSFDLTHEKIRQLVKWKKQIDKIIIVPKPFEIKNLKINEEITLSSYRRKVEIYTLEEKMITCEMDILYKESKGKTKFWLNNIEEVEISEEILSDKVIIKILYAQPEKKFYDAIIESKWEPSISFSPIIPLEVSINSQGKTIKGTLSIIEEYPSLIEEIRNELSYPPEPISEVLNPSVIGALIGYGREFYVPSEILEIDYIAKLASIAGGCAADLLPCKIGCTMVGLMINEIILE